MTRPLSIIASILIAAAAAFAAACSTGTSVSGSGGPGATIFSEGQGGAAVGAADASDETAPVMDVGNPEDTQEQGPYIDDPRIRRYYPVEEHGFRIAYPAGWTVMKDDRSGTVTFDDPDSDQSIGASWFILESSFDSFVDDTRDRCIELTPVAAHGFDEALMGICLDDSPPLHFESYAGKAVAGGTLIVVLDGAVDIKSPWQSSNTISTIPDDHPTKAPSVRIRTSNIPQKPTLDDEASDYIQSHYR